MEETRAAVVVVHSHDVIRAALVSLVQATAEFRLAAVASSATALRAEVFSSRPTVLIIGADDALLLTRDHVRAWLNAADVRLIAIGETFSNAVIVALGRLTVFDALVTWEESLDAVLTAARRLLEGESLLTHMVGKGRVVSRLLAVAHTDTDTDADALLSPLTSTDRTSIAYVLACEGRGRAARALGITPDTLYKRLMLAYGHLDIQRPYLAEAYALSRHFVTPTDASDGHTGSLRAGCGARGAGTAGVGEGNSSEFLP